MNNQNKNKAFVTPLFLGSLLGILEATLGYIFHLFSIIIPGIAGFFMFPIAFFIFRMAYKESNQISTVLLTAVIAASIKLINLFFPALTPISTINPAISLILEAMALWAFIKINAHEKSDFKFKSALFISLSWRIVFISYLFFASVKTGLLAGGTLHILRFLFLDSIINGFIIAFILKYKKLYNWSIIRTLHPGIALTSLVFVLALITEAFL